MSKQRTYVKLADAAKSLGVSPNTLRNWDKSGKLKARRHPVNKYRLYRINDVIRLLREQGELYLTDLERLPTNAKRRGIVARASQSRRESAHQLPGDPRFLKRTFRQLSRAFRDSSGGGLLERFEEISKLLFCKLLDEKMHPSVTRREFVALPGESIDRVYKRIVALFGHACEKYPSVFSHERARLSRDRAAVVRAVDLLQDLQLTAASGDIKGAAYEELIRNTFEKTDNQQFFTPRQIVQFMVDFVSPTSEVRICDPACGSGGFLIGTLHHVMGQLSGKRPNNGSTRGRLIRELVGAEIDPRMAWVAQMNLLMHGDGSGRVHFLPDGGSLAWTRTSCRALPDNQFDLVLTNPPFGSDFSDSQHLQHFQMGRGRTSRRRGVLFAERCLRMLRPGGLLGIILDDSVLSGAANADLRHLIFQQSVVEAVISLPDVAFMPYATAKASILFLRRKGARCAHRQGDIFMANAENIGHRPNGDPLYSEERDARGRRKLLSDLPHIVNAWRGYRRNGANSLKGLSPKVFVSKRSRFFDRDGRLSNDRLDVLFHHPSRMLAESTIKKSAYPTPRLMELVIERNISLIPSISQPDEACRYVGLASISARTGEYEVTDVPGDKIKSAVRLFRGGDIVVSKLRPELRKCAFILDDEEDSFVSAECLVLRGLDRVEQDPDLAQKMAELIPRQLHRVDSEYLAFMLRSDIAFGQLVYQCTGVGRPRVSKSSLLNVRIPLPPLDVQRQLLAAFHKANERHRAYRRRSEEAVSQGQKALEAAYDVAQASLCPSK